MQITEQPQLITDEKELMELFLRMEQKCADIEDFKDPGMKHQEIIEKFIYIQKCIQHLSLFSQNQKITDIHTQNLKYLCLPYHIGYLFGKTTNHRKEAVIQSRNYLNAFLNLCQLFNSEDQQIFPKNAYKTWKSLTENTSYKPSRDQLITNMKEKKAIEQRYQNASKIKDPQEQRQSIRDFISLQVYEAITQLKMIEQQLQILNYKQAIQTDQKAKEQHQQQISKPIPKMTYYQIKKPDQINSEMLSNLPKGNQHQCANPTCSLNKRQDLITQVWQQNANKPTISLEQVADMEYDNMMQRMEREKKQKQENYVDTDSDKEQNDARQKRKARQWDDWKDEHQKGAGNRNKGR